MIEETIQRIAPFIKKEHMYIATNRLHKTKVLKSVCAQGICQSNILFEPDGRNTFAPIAYLTHRIYSGDPEAVISVLPSDHVIKNNNKFLSLLKKASEAARGAGIVTFGVSPSRPETGYGYIKINPASIKKGAKIFRIDKFIEKPCLKIARRLIKDSRYYWNSGIFIFKAAIMLQEIKKFHPETYARLFTQKNFKKLWAGLPATSIDYAIMEKSGRMVLLPVDYGWLDMGSWQAIEEVLEKDKAGNIFRGAHVDLHSRNSLVWSQSRMVATIGLTDVIIVDTKDALLVCAKDKTQEVKKIVEALKQRNCKRLL
jgi:mannose-1-phosphate guanylyltransferase